MPDLKKYVENHPIRVLVGAVAGTIFLCFLVFHTIYSGIIERKNAIIESQKHRINELERSILKYKQDYTADSLKVIELNKELGNIKKRLSKYTSKEVLPPTTLCLTQGEPILDGALVVCYSHFRIGEDSTKVVYINIDSERHQIFHWQFCWGAEQKSFEYQGKEYLLNFQGFDESEGENCIKLSIYRK